MTDQRITEPDDDLEPEVAPADVAHDDPVAGADDLPDDVRDGDVSEAADDAEPQP